MHPESPLEQEDVPFPCMGCGEVGNSRGMHTAKLQLTHTRFSRKGKLSNSVCCHDLNALATKLTPLKLDRDGTSTASGAALAAPSSTRMHTSFC